MGVFRSNWLATISRVADSWVRHEEELIALSYRGPLKVTVGGTKQKETQRLL